MNSARISRQFVSVFVILIGLITTMIMVSCGDDKPTNANSGPAVAEFIVNGTSPSAGPAGRYIAYEASGKIAVYDLTTGVSDTISDFGRNPDWSPDNDTLVVSVPGGLYIVSLSTGDTSRLAIGNNLEEPDWSPTGTEILTMGRSPDGAYLTTYPAGVTEIIPCMRETGGLCQGEGPSFSGDGQWIAHEEGTRIMKVPRTGGTAQTVVGGLRDVTQPAWSPDNKYIAFVMEGASYQFGHIWVADSRGQSFGLLQVTDGAFRDSEPTWSADSRTIYFTRSDSAFSAPAKIYGVKFSAL